MLGSREQLCIHPEVKKQESNHMQVGSWATPSSAALPGGAAGLSELPAVSWAWWATGLLGRSWQGVGQHGRRWTL